YSSSPRSASSSSPLQLYRALPSANRNLQMAKVLIIGFGGLAKAALELLPICQFLPRSIVSSLVIIEPKTLMRESLLPGRLAPEYTRYDFLDHYESIVHLQLAITKENVTDLMSRVLPGKTLILDA